MTDLEQSLINEFGKLAKQYAEDQKRLSGQVERLEKQVRQLDESGSEGEKGYTDWLETMTYIKEEHQKMAGAHHEIDRRLRSTTKLVQSVSRRLHLSGERFDRAHSLIHREAEQKRQATEWRRVDGRIESLIPRPSAQSRGWDFSR